YQRIEDNVFLPTNNIDLEMPPHDIFGGLEFSFPQDRYHPTFHSTVIPEVVVPLPMPHLPLPIRRRRRRRRNRRRNRRQNRRRSRVI
ncbi:5177_t:CDS:1, partial [Ambispora leptoticha]